MLQITPTSQHKHAPGFLQINNILKPHTITAKLSFEWALHSRRNEFVLSLLPSAFLYTGWEAKLYWGENKHSGPKHLLAWWDGVKKKVTPKVLIAEKLQLFCYFLGLYGNHRRIWRHPDNFGQQKDKVRPGCYIQTAEDALSEQECTGLFHSD